MADIDYRRISDSRLLEEFANVRDQRAFAELVSRHGPMVISTCRRRLRNEQDCQDAFQATFLALVAKSGWIRVKSSLAGWLHRVAVRVAIDLLRSNANRDATTVLHDVNELMDPNAKTADHYALLSIDEELAKLPANYRNAIVLCHLEGYKSHEAAKMLGVPRNTLNSWLVRGRNTLRKRLAKQGIALSAGGVISTVAGLSDHTRLQAELTTTTTQAVTLYAAGSPAVESATVITLAKAALTTMMISAFSKIAILAIAASALLTIVVPPTFQLASSASAEQVFFDDFQEEQIDGWRSAFGSNMAIQEQSLVISVTDGFAYAVSEDNQYSNVSVTSQLRLVNGDVLGLSTRFNEGAPIDNYFAYVNRNGRVGIGYGTPQDGEVLLGEKLTSLNPVSQDVMLRFDSFGTTHKLWAWNAGNEMPDAPLLEVTHNGPTSGSVAMFAGTVGAFRSIAASVPEPSTNAASLAGIALLAGLLVRRDRLAG